MAEFILLAGAMVPIWDLAIQRHKKLNNPNLVFDGALGDDRRSITVQPIIYHPEQKKINDRTQLGPFWAAIYSARQARARTSATQPELDRSIYYQNGYMNSSFMRLDSEPVNPATHADFTDSGRGRLLQSSYMCVNNMLVRT
jgi:hypothetical protein